MVHKKYHKRWKGGELFHAKNIGWSDMIKTHVKNSKFLMPNFRCLPSFFKVYIYRWRDMERRTAKTWWHRPQDLRIWPRFAFCNVDYSMQSMLSFVPQSHVKSIMWTIEGNETAAWFLSCQLLVELNLPVGEPKDILCLIIFVQKHSNSSALRHIDASHRVIFQAPF